MEVVHDATLTIYQNTGTGIGSNENWKAIDATLPFSAARTIDYTRKVSASGLTRLGWTLKVPLVDSDGNTTDHITGQVTIIIPETATYANVTNAISGLQSMTFTPQFVNSLQGISPASAD